MPSMLIRNVDEALKVKIRIRAVQHGRSMEEEARELLRAAVAGEPKPGRNLGRAIQDRFSALGGVDLPEVERETLPEAPGLG